MGLTCITAGDTTLFFQDRTQKGIAEVECVFEDRKGNIWAGCFWSIGKYDGNVWKFYSREDSTAPFWSSAVKNIMQDSNGTILVGAEYENKLGLYDSEADRFTDHLPDYLQSIASSTINCLMQDHNNQLWFGTGSGGIFRRCGEKTDQLTTANSSLLSDGIRFLLEDQSKRVWAGAGNGIVIFNNGQSAIRPSLSTTKPGNNHLLSGTYDPRTKTVKITFSSVQEQSTVIKILS